jgi:hypothetical protein
MEPIRVFLGYDAREAAAFHVASHSIHRHSSLPVSITPVMLSQLAQVFDRPRDPKQSTDFSFSRFLVPYLCGYQGWAIFADCDILVRDDIANLWSLRDDDFAVMVVKHDHVPTETVKFLGHEQTKYPKKNWSSLILFNNARCQALTPDYVNQATGLALHRFEWLGNDDLIGDVPTGWNHLVDYNSASEGRNAENLHYTSGGPWFENCRHCGFAAEWWGELHRTLHPVSGQGCLQIPSTSHAPRKAA